MLIRFTLLILTQFKPDFDDTVFIMSHRPLKGDENIVRFIGIEFFQMTGEMIG